MNQTTHSLKPSEAVQTSAGAPRSRFSLFHSQLMLAKPIVDGDGGNGLLRKAAGYAALAGRSVFRDKFLLQQEKVQREAGEKLKSAHSLPAEEKLLTRLGITLRTLAELGFGNARLYLKAQIVERVFFVEEDGFVRFGNARLHLEAQNAWLVCSANPNGADQSGDSRIMGKSIGIQGCSISNLTQAELDRAKPVVNGSGRDICIPFRGDNGSMGFIVAQRRGGYPKVSVREKEILKSLISVSALNIESVLKSVELERLSKVDSLLELWNEREYHRLLANEVITSIRQGAPVALLALDLDLFRDVNNTYGHRAGDEFLRQFRDLVLSQIKRTDIFCRPGGEEFAIILPFTNLKGALAAAERIRKAVESHTFEVKDQYAGEKVRLRKTVSIGAAAFPDSLGVLRSELAELAARCTQERNINEIGEAQAAELDALADIAGYLAKGKKDELGNEVNSPDGRNRVAYAYLVEGRSVASLSQ